MHDARETRRRRVFAVLREELWERVEAARKAYDAARGEGRDRVSAGLAAMRAALEKQRETPEVGEGIQDRLRRMLGCEAEWDGEERGDVRARLDAALGRAQEQESGRGASMTQKADREERIQKAAERKPRDDRQSGEKPRGKDRGRDDGGYER